MTERRGPSARGPVPISARVAALRGTPGKRRQPTRAELRALAPTMPRWLTKEAKEEWKRVIEELVPLGLITRAHRQVLARYCMWWSRWVDLNRLIEREYLKPGRHKPDRIRNPLFIMLRQADDQLNALQAQLGVTPVARLRLNLDPDDTKDGEDGEGQLERLRNGPA